MSEGSDSATSRESLSAIPEGFDEIMEWVPSAHPNVEGVMVERWSIEKGNVIRKMLFGIYKSLPEETRRDIWKLTDDEKPKDGEESPEQKEGLDLAELLFSIVDKVDEKADEIIKLSIIPEHRDRYGSMLYEEKFELISAVLRTNPSLIPTLKKKAGEWTKQFGQMLRGNKSSTP